MKELPRCAREGVEEAISPKLDTTFVGCPLTFRSYRMRVLTLSMSQDFVWDLLKVPLHLSGMRIEAIVLR